MNQLFENILEPSSGTLSGTLENFHTPDKELPELLFFLLSYAFVGLIVVTIILEHIFS